jgi:arginyl-tRNA synthetase
MATYVLDVAQTFNRYYANCPIFKEENKNIVFSRLELVRCTKIIIENALDLLGIECPGKM